MKKYSLTFWATAVAALPHIAHAEGLKLISFSTLLVEMASFAILVFVFMKFVWPPLMNAIEKRQQEIADGLAAGEQGRRELEEASQEKSALLQQAREQGKGVLSDAEQRKASILDEAKREAEAEKARIIEQGRRDLEAERAAMYRDVENQLSGLVIAGAAQILQREVDAKAHNDIIDSLKKKL